MHRIELGDRAKIKGLFGSKRNATESRMIAGSCERAPILEERCARNRPGRRLRWLSRHALPGRQ